MRSILLGVVCLSTVVACGAAEPMPHDIADDVFRAVSDGDNVTWRALHDADAMVAFPDGVAPRLRCSALLGSSWTISTEMVSLLRLTTSNSGRRCTTRPISR